MKEKRPEYKKRKPDLETENLRIWKCDKKENPKEYEESKEWEKKGYYNEIDMNGVKVQLGGFTIVKEKDKIIFAYKFKHENCQILYYLSDELEEKRKSLIKELILDGFKMSMGITGINYDLVNIEEMLKSSIIEGQIMGKTK